MRDAEAVVLVPPAHVAVAVFESEAVLYDGSSNAIVRINGTASAIVQSCDGRTPLGDVIDELARSFGAARDEVAAGVHALVGDLAGQGLLEEAPGHGA